MEITAEYLSPLGRILLAADEEGLTGLWFENQKYFARTLEKGSKKGSSPILEEAARWLDLYFRGEAPGTLPPLHPQGTEFQQLVWQLLLEIPRGEVTTYGAIAARIAEMRGVKHFSAQAVGSAVGHNPISILIPCHRVIGADGSLTGYAGGIERKTALLKLEGAPCV